MERAEGRPALGQRRVDGCCDLHGIALTAYVHVKRCGARSQQMVVDRGDAQAAIEQLFHHRVDLGLDQHEIAHDHYAARRRNERNPSAERESWLDGDAVERDVEVGAWEPIAMDVTGHRRLSADRRVD